MTRLCGWLMLALALAGCGAQGEKFEGVDLTGVSWGKDFRLQDPDGRVRSLADFRGKVVAVFFGFVLCPDVCPTALARALEAKKKLGADGERLQVIFITVDPERDTAALLREYTAAFDPTFVGLRGTPEETRRVAGEFKVFYEKVSTGSSYTVNHSTMTYLFDPDGRLRVGLSHTLGPEQFARDVRLLLKRAS